MNSTPTTGIKMAASARMTEMMANAIVAPEASSGSWAANGSFAMYRLPAPDLESSFDSGSCWLCLTFHIFHI